MRLLGSHLGQEDRAQIEELWGAPCFDAYGTNESGMMAAECQHKSGMHIQEDAIHLEIADPETGRILPDGEKGTVYITTFYRHGAPQIRFNVNDISAMVPGTCACGSTLRRMRPHLWPQRQHGQAARRQRVPRGDRRDDRADRRTNGEFFCIVERAGEAGRDEMTVIVEIPDPAADRAAFATIWNGG